MLGLNNDAPTEPNDRSRMKIGILILVVLIFFSADTAVSAYWGAIHGVTKALAKISAPSPAVPAKPANTRAVLPAKPPTPSITLADVAGNKEGFDEPLTRQLTADPSLFDSSDCKNAPNAEKRADCNAFVLLVRAGIINRMTGWEMRVKAPNSFAFRIEKDKKGALQIAEYAAPTTAHTTGAVNVSDFTRVKTFSVATTVASSHFIGSADGSQSFPPVPGLYMYTG